MSRAPLFTFLAGLLLMPVAASAQDTKDSPPPLGTASFTPPESKQNEPLTPEVFAVRAAVANLNEIELSELALRKSANPALRQYAAEIVEDHKSAQARLKKIAATAKVALPATVDEEHRQQKQALAEQTGTEFDRRYIEMMQTGHERAATLLESAVSAPELDATFKSYARDTLNAVAEHRTETDRLASQLQR